MELLTKSIKDNNAYIEEWEQQKTEIENSNASEQLKRKKTERIDKKIREIQAANEQEKIEIMKKIHRIYADFYAKTGWINNKLKHQEMDMRWDNKNTCMRKAFFYELMGEYEGFNIRLDEYGNKCFYTPVLLPIQGGHFLPISLHFGSERNYQEFMIKTDAELDNYREDLPELVYRAKLRLRYQNKQSKLKKDDKNIPTELSEPISGSDIEKIQILVLKYSDAKNKYDGKKEEYNKASKRYKKEACIQEIKQIQAELDEIESELIRLCSSDKQFLECIKEAPTLGYTEEVNKNGLIKEIGHLLEIKSKKDVIEFIKKNPSKTEMVKVLFEDDSDVVKFIELVQDIQSAEDIEKRNELAQKLMYRCVGMGTEGEDAFFPTEDSKESQIEPIKEFIESQGIKIPELDQQIREAFDEKELLKSEEWDIGTEPLTPHNFAKILKKGMIDHNLDFDSADEAIDIYLKLDMLYGRDGEKSIRMIKNKIDNSLGKEEPANYEENKEIYDELYEDALEGRVAKFFEKLPLTFSPAELAEYYQETNEFEREWNQYKERDQDIKGIHN